MERAAVPEVDPTAGQSARLANAMERVGWTVADPAPLGLAGFAMTTFVLSMFNANLGCARDRHPLGWLHRARDCGGRVVRLLRRCHQFDVRADGAARVPIGEGVTERR